MTRGALLNTESQSLSPHCAPLSLPLPRYLPEFKPSPPDAAKCQPAVPLTEEDVRRIVRDELAKHER